VDHGARRVYLYLFISVRFVWAICQ
jgi:hypothetical protein